MVDEEGVVEGRIVWRWHRQRERSPSKAAEKKANVRAQHGELLCEVCDLRESEAKDRYDLPDGDVFEVHHTKPLHTLTGAKKTRATDLSLVCPTCHRAIHRIDPPLDVAVLRARLAAARA